MPRRNEIAAKDPRGSMSLSAVVKRLRGGSVATLVTEETNDDR
jgi:hypothetical protein